MNRALTWIWWPVVGSLAFVVAVLAAPCLADKLVLKDGRSFEGQLRSQTAEKIIFEVRKYGSMATLSFDVKDVQYLTRGQLQTASHPASAPASAPVGGMKSLVVSEKAPTYYLLPLHGKVGRGIAAAVVERAIDDARRKKVDVLILEVDSPGGHVQEAEEIIRVLGEAHGVRIIACVRSAISAAAAVTLACKEIYTFPTATIGAAPAYRIGPRGTPQLIEEKFQSIWRASCRKAAEQGGHSVLLAEGMTNPAVELSVLVQDGKPAVVEGSSGRKLKSKGQIMTLTSQEAVACGLVVSEIEDYRSLGEAIGLQAWREAGGYGRRMVLAHVNQLRRWEAATKVRVTRWRKVQILGPRIAEVDESMKAVFAEGRAAERTKALLIQQCDAQEASIQRVYENEMKIAAASERPGSPVGLRAQLEAAAAANRDARIARLQAQMQPQAARIQDEIHTLEERYRRLQARRKELIQLLQQP